MCCNHAECCCASKRLIKHKWQMCEGHTHNVLQGLECPTHPPVSLYHLPYKPCLNMSRKQRHSIYWANYLCSNTLDHVRVHMLRMESSTLSVSLHSSCVIQWLWVVMRLSHIFCHTEDDLQEPWAVQHAALTGLIDLIFKGKTYLLSWL